MRNSPEPSHFMVLLNILEQIPHSVLAGIVVDADKIVGPTGAVVSVFGIAFFLLRS